MVMMCLVGLAGCTAPDAPTHDEAAFVENGTAWRFSKLVGPAGPIPQGGEMGTLVGGLSVADADGDGRMDIVVADGQGVMLYRNQGDSMNGVRVPLMLDDGQQARSTLVADLDGDGWKDLFVVTTSGPDRLLRGGPTGVTDVSTAAGITLPSAGSAAAAADVDGDGDLDIVVGNYGREADGYEGGPEILVSAENGARNLLYLSNGNGTYTEAGAAAGLTATRWTWALAFCDYDRDGDPDLYVSNDFGYDSLYRNDGTGHFEDVAMASGVVSNRHGMGITWVDADLDGWMDAYTSNIFVDGTRVPALWGNNLFINQRDGTFADEADIRGVDDGLWAWGQTAFDADNDGDQDLMVVNGFATRDGADPYYDFMPTLQPRHPGESPPVPGFIYNATHQMVFPGAPQAPLSLASNQPSRAFENRGDGTFVERAGAWGLDEPNDGRAVVAVDIDRDGDLDLVATAYGRTPLLFENRLGGASIIIEPVGMGGNLEAVGTVVTADVNGRLLVRERALGQGFLSQEGPELHFGLGDAATANIEVHWPGGDVFQFPNVAAGRYTVSQATGELVPAEG